MFRVKLVTLWLGAGEVEGEGETEGAEEGVVPLVTVLRTTHFCVAPPAMVAVMVAVPCLMPGLTLPLASTQATSGSLEVQVIWPVEPAGEKVTLMVMGVG